MEISAGLLCKSLVLVPEPRFLLDCWTDLSGFAQHGLEWWEDLNLCRLSFPVCQLWKKALEKCPALQHPFLGGHLLTQYNVRFLCLDTAHLLNKLDLQRWGPFDVPNNKLNETNLMVVKHFKMASNVDVYVLFIPGSRILLHAGSCGKHLQVSCSLKAELIVSGFRYGNLQRHTSAGSCWLSWLSPTKSWSLCIMYHGHPM